MKTLLGIAATLTVLTFSSTALATNTGFSCSGGKGEGRKHVRVVGLTAEGTLVCFNEAAPRAARTIGYVTGLVDDTALIGIDFRVQDGLLYGVGNGGGVYIIDSSNANATLVNRLTQALDGTAFGVDFNPAADRLRIVSDTGQNLRHNVNSGGVTLADGALNYTAGTTALGIVAAAYTNNDLDALTATTLFGLDSSLDQIAIQSPPNNGSLAATGKLTVDAGAVSGFDIYSSLRNGVTDGNRGFAVLTTGADSAFYRVTLTTGKAKFLGKVRHSVVDIAVPLNQ
jgi:hypothetical protein